MTKDRGVDVVLNSLSGDALNAFWDCIASFGRLIEIGKKDIHSHAKAADVPIQQEHLVWSSQSGLFARAAASGIPQATTRRHGLACER